MPDHSYLKQKVWAAIETLAEDPGRIQERLSRVAPYFDNIRLIDENDVPERLQARVREFVTALRRAMADDEATQVVKDLFEIRRELEK